MRSCFPASGASVRHAATPTTAAAKMVRLRRTMPAGVCPRDMKTTIVAPSRPASVNSCHGCSASLLGPTRSAPTSVEVFELIVQARVQRRVEETRVAGDGGRAARPATRRDAEADQRGGGHEVGNEPRETVEATVDRPCQDVLAAKLLDEGSQYCVAVLALGEMSAQPCRLRVVVRAIGSHLATAHRGMAAARAHDLALEL